MTPSYEQILRDYPEYMSMEQMRIICHISKRTARLLLQTGLVPCVDNGKKTRKYQIATVDVITYLKERKKHPERYALPEGSYAREHIPPIAYTTIISPFRIDRLLFEESPDVLTVQQAAVIASVNPSTVTDWAAKKHFRAFLINNTYHIPKLSLLIYLASPQHSKNYRSQQYMMATRQCAATTE